MNPTLDQIKREAHTYNWARVATFPEPSGLSVEALRNRELRGAGHRKASLGGCVGLRQQHRWNGKTSCELCGKLNPKFNP